jgi:hypothetical protein
VLRPVTTNLTCLVMFRRLWTVSGHDRTLARGESSHFVSASGCRLGTLGARVADAALVRPIVSLCVRSRLDCCAVSVTVSDRREWLNGEAMWTARSDQTGPDASGHHDRCVQLL